MMCDTTTPSVATKEKGACALPNPLSLQLHMFGLVWFNFRTRVFVFTVSRKYSSLLCHFAWRLQR